MAYFFKYQWAEVSDSNYPLLRGKAFPILRYEVDSKGDILRVHLKLSDSFFKWFYRNQLIMYRGGNEFLNVADIVKSKNKSHSFIDSILSKLNMKRF